ncbi:MAG: hypothetical protein SF069_11155 [Phycisphaerae bacterium]|nr:hypothetical protein [Phycisphaerae bacterium]
MDRGIQPCSPQLDPGGGLPPGTPAWITPAVVERTLRVWQPRYRAPLTQAEVIAILIRVDRLLSQRPVSA